MDPSPLRALTSARGTLTISLAEEERWNPKPLKVSGLRTLDLEIDAVARLVGLDDERLDRFSGRAALLDLDRERLAGPTT